MTVGARLLAFFRRHAEWFWVPLVMCVVTAFLYRTIWWPPHGQPPQWFGWDCPESYWPDIAYYAGALRHGEWPMWNPYDRGGYAFYGDTVTGLYYPVTWGFVLPGAALGGMPAWAMQLKALLHLAMSGMIMHLYLRTRGLPKVAAAFAGAALILSVPMIIHKASAQAWPMIWAPIIWIAIDRAVERARQPGWWRRSAALGGAIFLSGAAGPPPGFFYILLMCLAYGALRLGQVILDVRRRAPAELRAELVAQARVLAFAGVLTVAMLLIVVAPGLAVAAESATRGAARNLQYSLNTALPAAGALKGMVAPWAGVVDPYLGLVAIALTFVGLVARPRADRWVPVLFFAIGVFALLLTFGGQTPLLPFLVKHVPGFGFFREPNRYKIVTAMAFVVVAAHGVAALVDEDPAARRRARLALAGVLGAIAVVLLLVLAAGARPKGRPPTLPGPGTSFVLFALAAALLGALATAPARFRAAIVAASLGLLWWDTAGFAAAFVNAREAPTDDQEDRRYLADLPGDVTHDWRVYDEFVMEQRPGSRLRIRDLRGYPSGDPFDDARYAQVRDRLKKDPELVAAYNVRWVLHGPHHRNGKIKNHITQPPDVSAPARFKKLDGKRWEVVDPAPLVAWYGGVQLADNPKQALDAVVAMEAAPGQRTRAVVERADVPAAVAPRLAALAPPTPPAPVIGRLLGYAANQVSVQVDAPAEGLVVVNEKMLPGWTVEVDGQAAAAVRTNYMLRGVVVGAGPHTIAWTYRPPRYGIYVLLWLAGVAVLAAAAVSLLRERRRVLASRPS